MENKFEENTFKDYYYKTLSDDSNDSLIIARDSSKLKAKRGEEDRLDDLFKLATNKRKKQCSSVSRAQANGGVAFISTNREDAASSSHLIKIEVYDMKKLANVPQEQHWKNANIRLKYFTNDTNQHMETINKIIYSITKEITQADIESQPPLLLCQTGCGAKKLMDDSGQSSGQDKRPRHQEPSTSTEDGNKVPLLDSA